MLVDTIPAGNCIPFGWGCWYHERNKENFVCLSWTYLHSRPRACARLWERNGVVSRTIFSGRTCPRPKAQGVGCPFLSSALGFIRESLSGRHSVGAQYPTGSKWTKHSGPCQASLIHAAGPEKSCERPRAILSSGIHFYDLLCDQTLDNYLGAGHIPKSAVRHPPHPLEPPTSRASGCFS